MKSTPLIAVVALASIFVITGSLQALEPGAWNF